MRNAVLGVGLVALATVLCASILQANATTAGFTYLIIVLAVAARSGFREAIAVSIAAVLALNFFFFPPYRTFSIADPGNWVALTTFLVTALVASHLSNRAKAQTAAAQERQHEMERLYRFSRTILVMEPSTPVEQYLAEQIADTFDCRAVAFYIPATGQSFICGTGHMAEIEAILKKVVSEGSTDSRPSADARAIPILMGAQTIGSLYLQGFRHSEGALRAMVNLTAIAMERNRAADASSRAEAARQSQQFKSALLDSVAHEFKTPLTSIKAASTALLSMPASVAQNAPELAAIIDEEADRLTRLVTEAVRMAQIEAGQVPITKEPVNIAGFLRELAAQFASPPEMREIRVESSAVTEVEMDANLIGLALRQVIDNACKYSVPDAPILIRSTTHNDSVEIRIIDGGPGIPAKEREQIFEKFYRRGASNGQVPGTGLGLYIAREIVRAHGGDLWLEDRAGPGAEFCLQLR